MKTMEPIKARRPERGPKAPDLIPGYFAKIDTGRLLSHREEKDLSKRAKAGDKKARQRLIEKNLRLVVSVAKKYRGLRAALRGPHPGGQHRPHASSGQIRPR